MEILKLPTEDFKTFFSRASREAKSLIGTRVSDWALDWAKGALLWNAHMCRDGSEQQKWVSSNRPDCGSSHIAPKVSSGTVYHATSFSWAGALVGYMDETYFRDRRKTESRNLFGALHTRSSTRAIRGHVHTRWHDCVNHCENILTMRSGYDTSVRDFLERLRTRK